MKLLPFTLAVLLGIGLLPYPLQAAEEVPWYEIELILFQQGSAGAASTEQWPDDPGSPDWSNSVRLVATATTDANEPQPYALLPRSAWQLTALFNGLKQTRGEIEPLFHQAWRQPVGSAREAQAIYLGAQPARPLASTGPVPQFEGLIKISVNRYFHVNLDLLLTGANRPLGRADGEALSSRSYGAIRFTANRRMRSGELHYLDHPRMGALILISRIVPPTPTAETTDAPQPEEPASVATEPAPTAEVAETSPREPTVE